MPDPKQYVSLRDAETPLFAGIDVGGTNIKIGLVDSQGRTLAYHTIPTEAERGPEDAAERMGAGVGQVIKQAGAAEQDVVHVGLATPGPLDLSTGMLLTPGNLPDWWNFPIRDRVSQHCRRPVRYANDANAAAYGEYWSGAGSEFHSMVLLTLGTGVGGGIVVGDTLIEGAHGCGSECGHVLIDSSPDARRDSLDKAGSLEAYCGAYAVVGRTNDALDAGRPSSLTEVRAEREITPLDVSNAAEAGDSLAREIVLETARYLALGIITLIHTIDPDSVVLGGAMTFGGAGHPLGEEFLQQLRDEVRPRLLHSLQEVLQIDFAQLGGDAGYIGAAGLARLEYLQKNTTDR